MKAKKYEQLARELAETTQQLNARSAAYSLVVAAINKKYDDAERRNDAALKALRERGEKLRAELETACAAERAEIFGNAKSRNIEGVLCGWERTKRYVEIEGDEAKIVAKLERRKLSGLVRVTKAVAKREVLNLPADTFAKLKLAKLGVTIGGGDEEFFAEVKP